MKGLRLALSSSMNSSTKQAERVREARAAAHRPDDGEAFLPDPSMTRSHIALGGTDAESFAEEFIASATAGEPVEMDAQDEVVEEELGGPFVELDAESAELPDAAENELPEPAGESELVDKLPRRGD
jgi:hypothetical protein